MSGVEVIYMVGVVLCLFSTGILNAHTRRTSQPLSYFVVYLGLESLCFVFELLIAHPATPLKALWLGLLMSTSLLVAPCLWLAAREAVEGQRPSLSTLGWRHRAVILAGIVLTLPLIETAHLGVDFHDPNRVVAPIFEPIIHETMLLCLALFVAQVPYYLRQCWRVLSESGVSARGLGEAGGSSSSSWLQIPLIVVCTTWLLGAIRTIMGAASQGSPEFFASVAFIDVSVAIGSVYMIVRRAACAVPLSAQATTHSSQATATEAAAAEAKYSKSQLDSAIRSRIVRKLDAAFRTEEIHRDARLSLGSLSRCINENEHYVSQVINQDLASTFYELVSRHRIEHAKRLLAASPGTNVLDIALSVGFNAKSTFNSAFRRHTGKTPREFRLSADSA